MKKTYVKPQLWKEAFQPADAIAGNCDFDVGFSDHDCTTPDPEIDGFMLFIGSNNSCTTTWEEGEDKGCYHVPVDGLGYFGS